MSMQFKVGDIVELRPGDLAEKTENLRKRIGNNKWRITTCPWMLHGRTTDIADVVNVDTGHKEGFFIQRLQLVSCSTPEQQQPLFGSML